MLAHLQPSPFWSLVILGLFHWPWVLAGLASVAALVALLWRLAR